MERSRRGGASSTPGLRPNPKLSGTNSLVSPVDRRRLLTAPSNLGFQGLGISNSTPSLNPAAHSPVGTVFPPRVAQVGDPVDLEGKEVTRPRQSVTSGSQVTAVSWELAPQMRLFVRLRLTSRRTRYPAPQVYRPAAHGPANGCLLRTTFPAEGSNCDRRRDCSSLHPGHCFLCRPDQKNTTLPFESLASQ